MNITHGFRSIYHRENNTIENRFYCLFKTIKTRCNNKKRIVFNDYGGRGIKCEWDAFDDFRGDMYKSYLRHIKIYGIKNTTIDRRDNNKGYSKANCRWATRQEQSKNTRRNINLTFKGKTMCLMDWAKKLGINRTTIKSRLDVGLSIKEAFTRPVMKNHYDN